MPSKATVSKEVAKTPRSLRMHRKMFSAVEPANLLSRIAYTSRYELAN
jgi:hypothetical protein